MKRAALLASSGLLLYGLYLFLNAPDESAPEDVQQTEGGISDAIGSAAQTVMSYVNNMTTTPAEAISLPNVQAFLQMIRIGEGTADAKGYSRIFGGRQFQSFNDHPRVTVTAGGYTSTAAGAYQFLAKTWDECRAALDLVDFSPASQDLAAVYLIKRRGALADVIAGRFETAINKCNREWASLPGSPYGQRTVSMDSALAAIASFGGEIA